MRLLLLGATLVALTPIGSAAVISNTLPFGLSITDSTNLTLFPQTVTIGLAFPQFDPAMGVLTGVQYSLGNSSQTQNLFVSGSRNSGSVNSASAGTTEGAAAAPGVQFPVIVFLDGISASCSGNPSCSATVTDSGIPTGLLSVTDLLPYIGLGTVGPTLSLSAGRSIPLGTPLFAAGLSRSANIDATWTGELTLVYTFDAPEPSTWVAGLAAIAALAFRRLRRRT